MSERLSFKMEGPIFERGVPLHLVIGGLTELHHVVDKTYIVLHDKKRVSRSDREQFQIVSHKFSSSSFLTEFEILLTGVQLALPFISQYGPQNIWDYTKETFSFLKQIFTYSKAGQQPTYTLHDDSTLIVNTGDTHHHYHAPVFQIGKLVLPVYQKYTAMLDKGGIENISIGKKDDPEIQLTLQDKGLFESKSTIDESPINVECDIFDFNKFKNSGKLMVSKDQPVKDGEYSFSLIGSQETQEYILSMLKPKVTINCLKEKFIDPLGETIIRRLHIIKVASGDASA